jgi:peptidoglycan/xylan/chitin deacetylase (PgdA/CDA1 family)
LVFFPYSSLLYKDAEHPDFIVRSGKNQMLKVHRQRKINYKRLRALTYLTLFAAVCSFVIGVSWSMNQHNPQKAYVNNALITAQPHLLTSEQPSVQDIEEKQNLHPESKADKKVPVIDKNTLKPQTFDPPASFAGKTLKEVKLAEENKAIALTFDDGPWPKYTQQILEILKKEDVKGTFFWIGRNVNAFPEIALQVVAEGHEIGNHTWSHSYRKMSEVLAADEIDDTAAIIESTTKVKTTLFRPPGGILTNGPAGYALSHKYTVLMWSADSTDYSRKVNVNSMVEKVLKSSKPGGMILMHDGGGDRKRTVEALPRVIASLKKQGYKFVTVTELLAMGESTED